METLLKQYNNFEECVLLEVNWLHHGFRIELIFDYIWQRPGLLHDNLDTPVLVGVVFEEVHRFYVQNDWTETILAEPEAMGWGVSEASRVHVEDDPDYLNRHAGKHDGLRHVAVLWEDERRIDIVCAGLQVHER